MPQVQLTRGEVVESSHPFSAVVVHDGQLTQTWGDDVHAAWRSAAKPFQLWCALEALGDPALSPAELAIGAASHAGQPGHVAQVRALLQRFGVEESRLSCGGHLPLNVGAAEAMLRAGEPFGPIHNNCSGKHTFMLAACDAQGWTGDYRRADHPLQRRVQETLTAWCGEAPRLGVDGCSVPTFLMPISAFGRAWSALARAMHDDGDPRLGRIGRAMAANPWMFSGDDRIDLDMMRGAKEPMLVKIGAAALYNVALPNRSLGLTVKIHSGVEAALPLAVEAALARFAPGAWARPEGFERYTVVRSVLGAPVGEARLVL